MVTGLVLLLGALFLKAEPIRRQQVIGCYTAAGAPTLHIRCRIDCQMVTGLVWLGDVSERTLTTIADIYGIKADEPIRRQQVIGCYTAAGAPTLHIRFDAIYVGDSRQLGSSSQKYPMPRSGKKS
jgi:hypothetical protein